MLLVAWPLWTFTWMFFEYNQVPRYSSKQVHNFVSFLHSLGCAIFMVAYACYATNVTFLYYWSMGYYMFDIWNYSLTSIFIPHHLLTMMALQFLFQSAADRNLIIFGLGLCEVSNWAMYRVYHNRHSCAKQHFNKTFWKWCEVISYLGLRNFVGIYYLFINPSTSLLLNCIVFAIWIASLYWGMGFLKSQ